jgi:NADPH-dependent 2,4-dienoyl-CoA reductase/sulfur reductase-like enzyme
VSAVSDAATNAGALPPDGRLVVVGGDAAGMSAAAYLARARPDVRIVVIERGTRTSYAMCGIPAFIGGEVAAADDLVARTPEQFAAAGITVRTGTEAVRVDPASRIVTVRDVGSGAEEHEAYDELLLATGAHPAVPDLPGLREYGHVLHTLDEAEHLRAHLDDRDDLEHLVVVGGGYIGLEVAEAFVRRGLKATIVDRADQVMASLDADMAAHVQAALERFGVAVRLGERLLEVRGSDGCCEQVVTDRATYPAEVLVLAMGSRPNVDLGTGAGCAVGPSGALVVDERMRTTVPHVWAAGDVVESRHLVSGQPVNVQLGTHANKQGRIAALNLAGEHDGAVFPGVVGTAATKVCEWEVARTGLTEVQASAAGLEFAVTSFTGSARAGYMPDRGRVYVKMLAERGTGRLLGAQLVGTGNVAKRIDVAATWCQLGIGVQQAQLADLSYAPPFGGVWDLLQVGARKLTRDLGLSPAL